MKGSRLASAVALAAALGTSPPHPDGIWGLLGTWSCVTARGTTNTREYTKVDAFTVAAGVDAILPSGDRITGTETYTFNPATSLWTVIATSSPSMGKVIASGPQWTASRMETPASWRLQGKWTGGERSEDFAMTYTITGPATFERTMAALHEGQWQPVVTETCTRTTPGS